MEAREFNEWMAFFAIEPFGEVRADHRAGLVAAMVLNSQGAKTKANKQFQPSDFFNLYGDKKVEEKQTGADMIEIMRGLSEK